MLINRFLSAKNFFSLAFKGNNRLHFHNFRSLKVNSFNFNFSTMSSIKVTAISKQLKLGEGPHWDAERQVLFYVDIFGQTFYKHNPETGEITSCKVAGAPVGLVVPVHGTNNQYLVGHGRKLVKVTWDGKSAEPSATEVLSEVDTVGDLVKNRINDGKCDPFGRLYFGTMGPEPKIGQIDLEKGSLFRFDANKNNIKTITDKISIANGLAWDLTKNLMYYIDTPTNRIDKFDYDTKTGELSNRRPVFDFISNKIEGLPDGMCIDDEGKLWVACFNGGQVIRVDPDTGRLMQTIKFPAKMTTSTAFGGPNRDILFVTSASLESEANNPEGGKVFKVTGLNVKGPAGVNIKL